MSAPTLAAQLLKCYGSAAKALTAARRGLATKLSKKERDELSDVVAELERMAAKEREQ